MTSLAPPIGDTDPHHRLGAACELLRQIIDPHSPLRLHERIHPGALNERIIEFLADEERRHHTRPPVDYTGPSGRAAARSIPWPVHAVGGLWPGHRVVDGLHGPGTVLGFGDDVWPAVLPLIAAGRLLVAFDSDADGRPAEHWVPAAGLTVSPDDATYEPF